MQRYGIIKDYTQKYAKSRKKWGKLVSEFNFEEANKYQDQSLRLINQIWGLPDYGKSTLFGLLNHEDEFVRLGAATNLLSLDEGLAKKNLHALKEYAQNNEVRYNAEMVIKEWDLGQLNNIRIRHNKI